MREERKVYFPPNGDDPRPIHRYGKRPLENSVRPGRRQRRYDQTALSSTDVTGGSGPTTGRTVRSPTVVKTGWARSSTAPTTGPSSGRTVRSLKVSMTGSAWRLMGRTSVRNSGPTAH